VTFTDATSYQVAQIPFSDFPGINSSRLDSVALAAFSPSGVDVKVGCISLIDVATAPSLQTCSCPDSAWLNYCKPGVANRNANGNVQSDDGTMEVAPVVTDGALVLQPSVSGSYWYSIQNCADISASEYLVLNVTASAGASFNVQLQSGGFGCDGQTPIQRLSVATTAYGSMNGGPVVLRIPLSDYTAMNNGAFSLKSIDAVALEGFSAETSTYRIHCAYFSSGAANGTATMNGTAT
jgi:hypothetical protein